MDWSNCTQPVTGQNNQVVGNVATLNCFPVLFSNLVNAALVLAGSVAVIFIIWGGIRFITSGGDPKRAEGARKTITWAIIGLLLIIFSFVIVNYIGKITGANCISKFGFQNCAGNTTGP